MKTITIRDEVKTWSNERLEKEVSILNHTDERTRRNWSLLQKQTVQSAMFELTDRKNK